MIDKPSKISDSKKDVMSILLITILATVIYSNTFYATSHLDDTLSIVENYALHRFDLKETFSTSSRSILYLTFALNYYLGKLNVFGYHLVNLVLHIANGVMPYFILLWTINPMSNAATAMMLVLVASNGKVIEPNYLTIVIDRLRDLRRSRLLPLTLYSMLIAVCYLLCVPHGLNAQPPVTYIDSIIEDEEEGRLSFPSFVFAETVRNEIYIIAGSRIIIYTSNFFPIFTLSKRNGIEAPLGLTVDSEGNLYVAQAPSKGNLRPRISVFNACLKWERDIYLKGFEGADSFIPYRLAIDKKGNIYIAGSYFPGVLVINSEGQLLELISPEEEDRKARVNNVTLDSAGKIYIVSEEEGRIYVYDENRKFLFKFGEKGGSSGKLSRPQAVGIDNTNGRMYVVDYMRHTISAYDKDGKYLFEFGGLGWGDGWFQYPRDLTVDPMGRVFIADTFNNRIQVFQTKD